MVTVIFIGGPSGTGKSTIAQQLSQELHKSKKCYLIEGDDWHSQSNIEKMSNNIPLTDLDRWPWLTKLTELAIDYSNKDNYDYDFIIITCSMLKKSYRDFLKEKLEKNHNIGKVLLFLLINSYENILNQMKRRKNHFFKETMLKSQFETFEKPIESIEKNVHNLDCNDKTPIQLAYEIEKFL